MVWFVMLITSWVTVVLDFICSTVLASILKKKNAEFLYFMARKVLLIKTINNFKKILYKAYTVHELSFLYFFFELNNTKTKCNILKYLYQRSYLLSCNRICDDMMYIYMADYTISRRYVGDIHQSNCLQYIQQDNL